MRNEVNEIQTSYCEKLGVLNSELANSSDRVAELLYQTWDKNTIGLHETFKVLLLNNANKVKSTFQASTGGLTGTLVDLSILFAVVLKTLSTAVILAHNDSFLMLSCTKLKDKRPKEYYLKNLVAMFFRIFGFIDVLDSFGLLSRFSMSITKSTNAFSSCLREAYVD